MQQVRCTVSYTGDRAAGNELRFLANSLFGRVSLESAPPAMRTRPQPRAILYTSLYEYRAAASVPLSVSSGGVHCDFPVLGWW